MAAKVLGAKPPISEPSEIPFTATQAHAWGRLHLTGVRLSD